MKRIFTLMAVGADHRLEGGQVEDLEIMRGVG